MQDCSHATSDDSSVTYTSDCGTGGPTSSSGTASIWLGTVGADSTEAEVLAVDSRSSCAAQPAKTIAAVATALYLEVIMIPCPVHRPRHREASEGLLVGALGGPPRRFGGPH